MKIPLFSKLLCSDQCVASIILIVMLTQFVFIEGYTISPIKVGLMAFMPLFLICKVPYVSKACIWGIIYLFTIIFSGLCHPTSFRFSTIGYLSMFVITFVVFYNLIYWCFYIIIFCSISQSYYYSVCYLFNLSTNSCAGWSSFYAHCKSK